VKSDVRDLGAKLGREGMVIELINRLRAFDPDAEVSRATSLLSEESMKWIVKLFFGNHSAKHAAVLISYDWCRGCAIGVGSSEPQQSFLGGFLCCGPTLLLRFGNSSARLRAKRAL
jgi:hypothetical protein